MSGAEQEQNSDTFSTTNPTLSVLAANATYGMGVAQQKAGELIGHQGLVDAGIANQQKGNEDYEAAQVAREANAPSKLRGDANTFVGATKERIGTTIGVPSLVESGAEQRRRGNEEYETAKATAYIQGAGDVLKGKVEGGVASVIGDEETKLRGEELRLRGEHNMKMNRP